MKLTKRKVITAIGVTGFAGLIGPHWWKSDYQFKEGGQLRTSDSILADNSIDSNSINIQYSLLVSSKSLAKQIKWDYINEEDPVFTELFRGTDFDKYFLAVSGVYLPRDEKIGTTKTTFEEGVMQQIHEIRPPQQEADESLIHNVIEKWELNGRSPPKTIEVDLTYRDDPIGD